MGKKNIIFLLAIFVCMTVGADVISVNFGGGTDIVINSNNYFEGFFGCVPTTCAKLGYDCGSWSDMCGKTLNCGSCSPGYTCSNGVCVAAPGGGGAVSGGGGALLKPTFNLRVIPNSFNLASSVNQTSSAKIDVLNTGNSNLDVLISLTGSLSNIIKFNDGDSFTLLAGGLKTLTFQITAPASAGIYTGKIIFSADGGEIVVPFVLNVRSGINLFDVSLDIPEDQRIINVGDKLTGQINLLQAGIQEPMDVSLHYIVKNFEDKIYLEETETLMVYKQKNYEHEFDTQNLPAGDYIIGVEVIYSGGVATASYPFRIIEKEVTGIPLIYIALIGLLIMAIISLILIIKYYKQQKRKYKKRK